MQNRTTGRSSLTNYNVSKATTTDQMHAAHVVEVISVSIHTWENLETRLVDDAVRVVPWLWRTWKNHLQQLENWPCMKNKEADAKNLQGSLFSKRIN